MKKAILFASVLSVLLFSGCIQADFGGVKSLFGMSGPEYTATERLSISASSVLSEVEGGRNTTLIFDLVNQGNTTVKGVDIKINDLCVFQGPTSGSFPEIEPGQRREWEVPLKSEHVNMNRDCDIRYTVSYSSNATALYDISAISESEYLRLKKEGKLENKTDLSYYKTKTPIEIQISTPETQPMVENDTFLLNIKLVNQGAGSVEGQKLEKGSVELKYPNDFLNWKEGWCQGVMKEVKEGELSLNAPRTFYGGEAAPITCRFKVSKGVGDLTSDRFEAGVKYKYVVDKELPVKVIPS